MKPEDITLGYFDSEDCLGSKMTSPLSLPLEKQALRVKLWAPPINMPAHHWHGHIEINIPFDDDVEYFYNGALITIKANHIAAFWAAIPHSLINRNQCSQMLVIDIPIHQFLSWQLPHHLVTHITHGVVIQSTHADLASPFEGMRWEKELAKNEPLRNRLVYNEVQLLLKRLELDGWEPLLKNHYDKNINTNTSRHTQHYVIQMLNYIGSHFNQPITVSDVANAVDLNTNYAMGLFQSIMHLTIKQYITMMRINHAKALLSDTDKTTLDISLTAGFNSLSRFYNNFQKYTGLSPINYRKKMRGYLLKLSHTIGEN